MRITRPDKLFFDLNLFKWIYVTTLLMVIKYPSCRTLWKPNQWSNSILKVPFYNWEIWMNEWRNELHECEMWWAHQYKGVHEQNKMSNGVVYLDQLSGAWHCISRPAIGCSWYTHPIMICILPSFTSILLVGTLQIQKGWETLPYWVERDEQLTFLNRAMGVTKDKVK